MSIRDFRTLYFTAVLLSHGNLGLGIRALVVEAEPLRGWVAVLSSVAIAAVLPMLFRVTRHSIARVEGFKIAAASHGAVGLFLMLAAAYAWPMVVPGVLGLFVAGVLLSFVWTLKRAEPRYWQPNVLPLFDGPGNEIYEAYSRGESDYAELLRRKTEIKKAEATGALEFGQPRAQGALGA